MSNPINMSGKEFESLTERTLILSRHSYKGNKSNGIDYDVEFGGRLIGLEVKAQKQGGSVDEKLTQSVFKYAEKYNEIVFLFHPSFKLHSKIKEGMEFVAKHKDIKLNFLWGIKDLEDYLSGNLKNDNSILTFC